MVIEYTIMLEGTPHPVIISDEPEALQAAKAAGRAIIGVDRGRDSAGDNANAAGNAGAGDNANAAGNAGAGDNAYAEGSRSTQCAAYVIPGFEDASEELAELVLRRHLGLPWTIGTTERLLIRELVKEDAGYIPEEEYAEEEAIFRSQKLLALYIEKQYGFYEYGTWALVRREDGNLIGIAGVSNPRLSDEMDRCLESQPLSVPWLELGYHIFGPYRGQGYASEAVKAIADYSHEVLSVRLCALIYKENQASRWVAEGLAMKCIMETDTESSGARLLYAESPVPLPDREDP